MDSVMSRTEHHSMAASTKASRALSVFTVFLSAVIIAWQECEMYRFAGDVVRGAYRLGNGEGHFWRMSYRAILIVGGGAFLYSATSPPLGKGGNRGLVLGYMFYRAPIGDPHPLLPYTVQAPLPSPYGLIAALWWLAGCESGSDGRCEGVCYARGLRMRYSEKVRCEGIVLCNALFTFLFRAVLW